MISINVKRAAENKGIKTAYQFQKATGFPPAMAARVFKGEWKRIDVSTLDTICSTLECTPNDILNFTLTKTDQF